MPRFVLRALCALALLPGAAVADPYDFRVYLLGNPVSSATANANFRLFARQFGAAMTSVNLAPAETLGHSGFSFTLEMCTLLGFDKSEVGLPTESPGGRKTQVMLVPSVHIRKGLPWSFELGARGGWIEKSRMGIATLELKWAINEGFRYLPDLAVRGAISKLINSRDFDVTAGGLDLGIGKQFALGGMVTLTIYGGWNLVFVGASSGTVDFDPSRPLADADTSASQYQNYWVFQDVYAKDNSHSRFYGGLRFIGGVAQLGFEASYSMIEKFTHTDEIATNPDGTARGVVQFQGSNIIAINGTIGLDF